MKKIDIEREDGGGGSRPGTGGGLVPKPFKDKTGLKIAGIVVAIALLVFLTSQ